MTSQDTFGLVTGSTFLPSRLCHFKKKNHLELIYHQKFTISLKILAKSYFQLNCTGKFSVA